MEYKVYRLAFQGAVHFGKRQLESCEYTFCADTLFSALCLEAVKMGKDALDHLYQLTKEGRILFSDAFPYMGDSYLLPKPMKRIEVGEDKGNSTKKKAFKKLKYIPASEFETYLMGQYDVTAAVPMDNLGKSDMKVSASVCGEEQTMPYRISTFSFYENNGLYFIAGYEKKEELDFVEELLRGLAFSGLGGKRASGLGRFKMISAPDLPETILRRLKSEGKIYMTLSVSLPKEEELDDALADAEYLLGKRSGFVASDTYADSQHKKKDLYVLMAGSCVRNRYQGDIYDVSEKNAGHAVYRYAKPLFMEVSV